MPNSLKVKIKKLLHDGKIDTEECDALLNKLEGHDAKVRATAIEEFKERLLELCDGGEECIDCVGGTCTRCFENSVDYSSIVDLAEELKDKCEADDVRHGYWHLLDDCANDGVYCSECHKKVYRIEYANQKIKSKYCPNCGAIMDLEEKQKAINPEF